MPLVRVEVRNEYRLGAADMYRQANKEEPKEILQGVSVAGLVGVLRQLGDLADFAAEIFHGLQEEMAITTSRSHKLIGRVQRLEAELSPLEKSILAQRSHLHFAYTPGSNWHARIPCDKNHFMHSDMPQFIFDSCEDCRGPPRFYLLDRFDPGGPGSCLERYSDPAFFKRASAASGEASIGKVPKDKGNKVMKQRLWPRNREIYRGASYSNHGGRTQFTQFDAGEHSSPSLKSDLSEQSNSDLRNGSDYIKGDFRPSCSLHPKEQESRDFRLDDFASETENFMDAFNSIEPESETDVDCMRKQDIDHYIKSEYKAAEDGLPESKNHIFKYQASNFESNGMPISGDMKSDAESQKPTTESSNVTSFTFWTNGGLLGLQPSQPPDFSLLNDLGRAETTESIKNIEEGLDTENDMSFRKICSKISTADSDIRIGKTGHLLSPEYTRCSSRTIQLSNRLLTTSGSDKRLLHSGEVSSRPDSYQTFSERAKNLFLGGSLMQSPSSSPPLTYMKISLQPIDGFETSKLKLKSPNGKTNSESSRDIFSSFQLVPESPITKRNIGSDSGDETFSRSSPSLSDNCPSYQSDQNSEHCETGESPGIKDPDLYDSLCRISFRDSIPTVMRNFSSSLTALQKELRNDTTPDPPPLPPVQWRSMKPHLDYTEDMFQMMPKASNYAFDLKHSKSTISQEPKPAPLNHDQILETRSSEQKSEKFGKNKSNEGKEANQGKSINEKEDFLHQIRAKSFSLRPTMPAKPTVPSGGSSSNVHVSAIVQKANAIRQAVGSDDGDEDGNWSDA